MKTVWRSLLWKEWREHRWKMASLAAISAGVALYLAITESGDIYGGASIALAVMAPLAAMFVGMGIAAGEQSRGTIGFLQALPTSMAKPAAAKLIWGAFTIIAVVAMTLSIAFVWRLLVAGAGADDQMQLAAIALRRSWGITNWSAGLAAGGMLGGISILVWLVAAGMNRSDEVRAGAIGLLVSTAIWVPLVLLPVIFPMTRHFENTWYYMLRAAAPGGPASTLASPLGPDGETVLNSRTWFAYYGTFIVAAVASHGALVAWFLLRFGRVRPRVVQPEARIVATPMRTAFLAPPRKSPLRAIAWKQLRESGPLALLGAALVIVAATGAALMPRADVEDVFEFTTMIWIIAGAFVAIVAGVGLFMDDLRSTLHTFWRSRPISVGQWFVVKLAVGTGLTVGVLALPLAALALGVKDWSNAQFDTYLGGLAAQIGLFAAGVAAMALVRQAVYAAILAIAVWAFAAIATVSLLDALAPRQDGYVAASAMLVAPTATATIVAWLAVRNDWGWKG